MTYLVANFINPHKDDENDVLYTVNEQVQRGLAKSRRWIVIAEASPFSCFVEPWDHNAPSDIPVDDDIITKEHDEDVAWNYDRYDD